MKALCLKGKVFSGKNDGAGFIGLSWVRRQIVEKLGFCPYPGTLNLKLDRQSVLINQSLRKANGITILPECGFCSGKLFKASVSDSLECAVVMPEIADYPENVIEIIARPNLRQTLKLQDGDHVEIKVVV